MQNVKRQAQNGSPKRKVTAGGGLQSFSLFAFRFSLASQRGGFTLLEMVVSFGIFSVVIIVAIGAVLAINNAQIKASNIQNIQDNLRFAVESMTKEMRTGRAFAPFGGSSPAYAGVSFTRSDNTQVGYCREGTALRKISGGGTNCASAAVVTGESIVIEQLTFYIIGHGAGSADGQPRVTVSLSARSRDPKLETTLRLQTTVVPRERDR